MEWPKSVLWMFITSIILGFFITTSLLVNDPRDIKSSQTKIYTALFMALWMVAAELAMFPNAPLWSWILTISGIIIIFYLARRQKFVDDSQYLKAMIQHHSSAILTSDSILEKTQNDEVRKLANQISKSQQEEIDLMNNLLLS